MKNTRFVLVSCVAAGALMASPAFSKPAKKAGGGLSRPHRAAARTAQMVPRMGGTMRNGGATRYRNTRSYAGHQYTTSATRQRATTYYGSTPRYRSGTRYTGTGAYAGRQYSGTRYYNTPRYGANTYYGGTRYYYGGGYPYYDNSSVWPYVAASVAPYVAYSLWAPGYGGYPYSYYGGYPYNYSYYGSRYGYGYAGSTVAAVQRRLGELGYYHGAVDGVIGPRTRSAIAAFESRHGMVVDGRITRPLIDTLGLA